MKIGLSLPTMLGSGDGSGINRSSLLAWCRRIEDDGYDTLGIGERISYRNLEMFSVLSAAAAVTERVRLASTIVVLPMHSEVWVAKQTATLDVLSGGRVTLGVGVGGRREDYDALGRSFDHRFQRLDDQVERIRSVWAGDPPGAGLEPVGPTPIQEHLPILSGSMGPKSLARSAVWADGIAGFEMDPALPSLERSARAMTDAWDAAGRSTSPHRMTSFWFSLGDDAEERLRGYARHYLAIFGAELADALAASCTAAGTDGVRRAIDACRDAGFDEIQLVPTSADLGELDQLSSIVHTE